MDYSRRAMLGAMGGFAIGAGLVSMTGESLATAQEPVVSPGENGHFKQVNGEFGWKPQRLDVQECVRVAYEGYWYKGYACGYGTFYGIVGMMGEKYGAPYNQFPFTMLEANKGGISDWGTICGALYGAVAAFALFYPRKDRDAMVNELFRWYEKTALPIYNPGDAARGVKGDIPANASGSVLCHVSVGKWCYANNQPQSGKMRSERCGRITADVTAKAVEILMAKMDAGKDYKGAFAQQESVAACKTCHSKGNEADFCKTNMDCQPCHSGTEATRNKFVNHP